MEEKQTLKRTSQFQFANMEVLVQLVTLLVIAKIFSLIAMRLGHPPSTGEILVGILVAALIHFQGESLPFLNDLEHGNALTVAADIGVFCLMVLAGVETRVGELTEHSGKSLLIAMGGIALPLAAGFMLAWAFIPPSESRFALSLLTGIALSITAVPATTKVLQELDLVHTRFGKTVLGAALVDDVIGLLLLAGLLGVVRNGGDWSVVEVLLLLIKASGFFVLVFVLGVHVYPHVSKRLNTLQATSLEFGAMAVIALGYGLVAELLGLHWVIGAFAAGLFFEKSRVGIRSYNEIKLIFTVVTRGMLAPLFFVSIGMQFEPSAFAAIPGFIFLVVIVSFLGKILGCGIPAFLLGNSLRESAAIGVGMSMRGAVVFIVLNIAADAGLFITDSPHPVTENLYSCLVIVGVLTTMTVPSMLRKLQLKKPRKPSKKSK